MLFYLRLIGYYTENMLPGILSAVLAFACLYRWRQRRLSAQGLTSSRLREGILLLFWAFCGGMAVLTMTPWGFHWITLLRSGIISDQGTFFSLGTVNLIPFRSLELGTQTRYTLFNFLGNMVMFLPFGFFTALLWRNRTWKRELITGVCITGFIEMWQLFIGRACDIDDLMLNMMGVMCGYWIWKAVNFRMHQKVRLHCQKTESES